MNKGIEQIFCENIDREKMNWENIWGCLKKGENRLLPAIIQDFATREVLMLAYMNPESFEKTLESGIMHYWSRSRNKLWMKGETSGNIQRVIEAKTDCDFDTLLFIVEQTGNACHTGQKSCFFRKLDEMEKHTKKEGE